MLPPLLKKVQFQLERNNHYGIYEYIQVNLAYSSSRMPSNRLARQKMQKVYRSNRITPAFEVTKVDDIIEIPNHFVCSRYVIEDATLRLTVDLAKRVHRLLTCGTYADKGQKISAGAFRSVPAKRGVPAEKITRNIQRYCGITRNYLPITSFRLLITRRGQSPS